MATVWNLQCCGVKELHQISSDTPSQSVKSAASNLVFNSVSRRTPRPFVIFTGLTRRSLVELPEYAEDLKAYILEQKLGTVIESEERLNGNSGHYIKVYLWQVDNPALTAWYYANSSPAERVQAGIYE